MREKFSRLIKKFQINPKKFQINPKKFEIKKKFQIDESEQQAKWLRQNDLHSCGYYMIHNSQPYLKMEKYEGNPEEVFKKVNELRQNSNKEPISRTRNLHSFDLSEYLTHHGLNVTQLSNTGYDKELALKALREEDFNLIYLTSNAHYTAIAKEGNNLFYLDSFRKGPKKISLRKAEKEILNSLGKKNGRNNLVGIVKNNS